MPEGAPMHGLDILLVEDDQALADMYAIKLTADGNRVEIAADGPSGLRAALQRPPDVLILDVRLPGFDGFQLLARLRQDPAYTDLPVIVLSSFGEAEMVEQGAALGAVAHLIKSQTTPGALAETIRNLVRTPAAEMGGV